MIFRWSLVISQLLLPAAFASELANPLSLQQAVSIALERNYDLQLAQSAVASARAYVLTANAAPNPTLAISAGSINLSGGMGSGALWRKQIDTIVSASQLIERGGKRELRTESARYNARAVSDDLRDVRRQLKRLVAQAYVDLHVSQDRVMAAQEAVRLLEATLTAAQLRRDAGDIAGADVERVRVDALRARNDVTAAEAERRRAQQLLAFLLADTERADVLQAADEWPIAEVITAPDHEAMMQMIERRADVRAASARTDSALAAARLAESLRTRDISVGLQYEHFPQPSSNPSGNSFGFAVQVPLFTRYYYEGEIGASLAALDAARVNLERIRAAAETEINSAALALVSASERLRRHRDELLLAAEKSAQAAEYAYQNGAVGVMDVLDARRTLRATRLDALTAQADFSKALASWQAATELSDEDMK
jgi:cobalt-zinc-cadmium efflux system outer membrane protein